MDDIERLRRFIVNADGLCRTLPALSSDVIDRRTIALVRIGALCAVGAPTASIWADVDEAVTAGVSGTEIVDVLTAIVPIIGMPRAVSAAPKVALALGYDIDLLSGDSR